jgi:hypothetical protein
MAKSEGKQLAVLVDEVQRNVNSKHWDYRLKKAPSNLLVVGTGISELDNKSLSSFWISSLVWTIPALAN